MTGQMSLWRDRGVVQDSDDDEQDFDSLGSIEEQQNDEGHIRDSSDAPDGAVDAQTTTWEQSSSQESCADTSKTLPPLSRDDLYAVQQQCSKKDAKVIEDRPPVSSFKQGQILSSGLIAKKAPIPSSIPEENASGDQEVELHSEHVGDISSADQRDQDDDIFDIPSSGLSSPPDSPDLAAHSSPHSPAHERYLKQPFVLINNERIQDNTPLPCNPGSALYNWDLAGRSLRHRTALQLHPYMLEKERYRNSLKASGLQPVQIASQNFRGNVGETAESQNQDAEDHGNSSSESDFAIDTPPSSSPPLRASSLPSTHDRFPDIDTFLRSSKPGEIREGHKKRRTSEKLPKPSLQSSGTVINQLDIDLSLLNGTGNDTSRNNSFKKPVRRKRRPKFKMPPGFSPETLPTPAPTSEIPSLDSVKSADHDSDLDPEVASEDMNSTNSTPPRSTRFRTQKAKQPVIISDESSEEASQPEQEPDRWKKRIRGVLPASWLKLDREAKKAKEISASKEAESSRRQRQATPPRGVARKIDHTRTSSTNTKSQRPMKLLEISSESESPSLLQSPLHPVSGNIAPTLQSPPNVDFDDGFDIPEYDWIDPMLPKKSRQRKRPDGKKQTRITDSLMARPSVTLPLPQSKLSHVHSRTSGLSRPRRRHSVSTGKSRNKKSLPETGLLDVLSPQHEKTMPDFLRFAAYRIAERQDKGRDRPNWKTISLQSRNDGVEVDNALHEWRGGSVKPKETESMIPPAIALRQANTQGRPRKMKFPQFSTPKTAHNLSLSGETIDKQPAQNKQSGVKNLRQISLQKFTPALKNHQNSESFDRKQPQHRNGKNLLRAHAPEANRAEFSRPGQLETLQNDYDTLYPQAAFRRKLGSLEKDFRHGGEYQSNRVDANLSRLFGSSEKPIESLHAAVSDNDPRVLGPEQLTRRKRNPRKRRPRQLQLHEFEVHQLQDFHDVPDNTPSIGSQSTCSPKLPTLEGLGEFGTTFTTDFGIVPLPIGVCFHQSTFIGSGELQAALCLRTKDLDHFRGTITLKCGDLRTQLGSWSEETASRLRIIFDILSRSIESATYQAGASQDNVINSTQIPIVLQSIISYCSSTLSFTDPVDRKNFVELFRQYVSEIYECAMQCSRSVKIPSQSRQQTDVVSRILLYLLVLQSQVHQISYAFAGCDGILQSLGHGQTAMSRHLLKFILHYSSSELKEFQEPINLRLVQERGIQKCHPALTSLETVLACYHILNNGQQSPDFGFWNVFCDALWDTLEPDCVAVSAFEDVWHKLFAILPLLQIDVDGVFTKRIKDESSHDTVERWSLVKKLTTRLFDLWHASQGQPSINAYVRAILSRCHRLISTWKWRKSESMLSCVFDFFARNNLALLRNEDSSQATGFLESISWAEFPLPTKSDRSFQIFLKLLATGLIGMRKVYPVKKIRNIAWRFVPNHGRFHSKDDELQQVDLDALRNHHELLCVLYYASPTGVRPDVKIIRSLLDINASHIEIFRLNTRAWTNLTRFQLEQKEDLESLGPLCTWINEILHACIYLHGLAREEAECHSDVTNGQSLQARTRNILERTIANNQRHIEALLKTILTKIKELIKHASSFAAVDKLFRQLQVSQLLDSLSPEQKRVSSVLILVVDVFKQYFECVKAQDSDTNSQQNSEESQDYGEWPSDSSQEAMSIKAIPGLDETFVGPISKLLSDCFGADYSPDERLMTNVLETWTFAASIFVRNRRYEWSHYLDHHSTKSWYQLRGTSQTRRFTPLFLSLVLGYDPSSFQANESDFLIAWIECLVERESLLKYQHSLTNALLNLSGGYKVLKNLPFARNPRSSKYTISLDDFRQRRLSLISSILANIREGFETTRTDRASTTDFTRENYITLIKSLMSAMRNNYQEIQETSPLRGSYIDFVQTVVQFLQQYIHDICPIDKYFTDSAAFPLPIVDPLYVVGRLKSYQVRSGDIATQKKLAAFVQSTCERAAIEDQQEYLVEQLTTSLKDTADLSTPSRPSLRWLLLEGIIPSYLELSATTDACWLLARPIFDTVPGILDELLNGINLNAAANLEIVGSIVSTTLSAIHRATYSLFPPEQQEPLSDPRIVTVLTAFVRIVTSTLTTLEYLARTRTSTSPTATTQINNINKILTQLTHIFASLPDTPPQPSPPPHLSVISHSTLSTLQYFTTGSLSSTLSSSWSRSTRNGTNDYFVRRGAGWRQVHLRFSSAGEMVDLLVELRRALEEFARVKRLVHGGKRADRASFAGADDGSEEASGRGRLAWDLVF